MAPLPLTIIPAADVAPGDQFPAYDGFGSTAWLEVVSVTPLEDTGEVEMSFGPGADYRVSAMALVPVARPHAGA